MIEFCGDSLCRKEVVCGGEVFVLKALALGDELTELFHADVVFGLVSEGNGDGADAGIHGCVGCVAVSDAKKERGAVVNFSNPPRR